MDGSAGSQERQQRDDLIEEYQGYVRGTVRKLVSYMGLPANRIDDFVSAGYEGLVEAASRFNPAVNDSFKNYSYLRIRGAVIDFIRQESEIGAPAYKRVQALAAAHEIRMEEFNRGLNHSGSKVPGNKSAKQAETSSQGLERILNLAAKTALTHRLSFDDSELELQQSQELALNPEQALEQKQNTERIHTFLATLPEKERLVIENFYFKDMSFTDIAEKHAGLSKSWISRIHDNALEQLKRQWLRPRKPLTDIAGAAKVEKISKTVGRGRPAIIERRLSRADSDKPKGKRGKSSPRTLRRGRVFRNKKSPS